MATDRERLESALVGADYPASKSDLVTLAERNGADEGTHKALRALQPENYENFGDVVRAAPMDAGAQEGQSDSDKAQQNRQHTKDALAERMTQTPNNPIEEELGENRGS